MIWSLPRSCRSKSLHISYSFALGELVITEDTPAVEDRVSDEDDEVVDVDSVDDVDPRDRLVFPGFFSFVNISPSS